MEDHDPVSPKGVMWLQDNAFRLFFHEEIMEILPGRQFATTAQKTEIFAVKAILKGNRDAMMAAVHNY